MSATARSMDAVEIADFLESQDTGVLGLAMEDNAYAIPLSYTYDDNAAAVLFRLGYGPDSQKREYVAASDTVSFVVYTEPEEAWKSVMVQGTLTELSSSSLDASIVESVRSLDIPFYQVHDRAFADLDVSIVELSINHLHGIVGG